MRSTPLHPGSATPFFTGDKPPQESGQWGCFYCKQIFRDIKLENDPIAGSHGIIGGYYPTGESLQEITCFVPKETTVKGRVIVEYPITSVLVCNLDCAHKVWELYPQKQSHYKEG